ncbi:fatty acid desaturase [Planktothrix sp. FACHB-1355]|uniref:Fatty acid desaturase n=1 Tax=Aerosakkonema funiforme FACHB-1375 TaxID=2949571 RepID=A0A926ZG40_9CYAN|nr:MULTISPECIES: fatty acid desaturase [Oscillatoriales]MBD2181329.1 fatty acid desaturase [Aerosakkonema funiforme FACHB-1375]MBD3557553.1 fatty acid desaturase [Planktothrix sp. FACHB-1355]
MQTKTPLPSKQIAIEHCQSPVTTGETNKWGIIIACGIIGLWTISIVFFLSLDIANIQLFWLFPAVIWQMFLYTGLFITAHDAMHGVVFPQNKHVNNLIGTLALFLYGLFSYKNLLRKHWLHHHHPATGIDPDFHDGEDDRFFAWYFHFMKGYWIWKRMLWIVVIFLGLHYLLQIPIINLILFWVIASILSSVQLFYFGTFLTHREPTGGYTNPHRTRSTHFSVFWSFLTCYHFGYHKEHHEYPNVPWWKLAEVYKRKS